jgi:hypothetical protein
MAAAPVPGVEGVVRVAECLLRKANGRPDVLCDGDSCVFWRVVDQLGVIQERDWSGCAIQYFALLDGGEEIAAWLLSAKERALAEAEDR